MISIKVHDSYRRVVAISDSNIIGKKFEEGKKQLEVRENFYRGNEFDEKEAIEQIKRHIMEDSTFNIVGEKSIRAAISAEAIDEDSCSSVSGIPFALKLI